MTNNLLIDLIDNISFKTRFDKNTNIYTVNIYIPKKYYKKDVSNKLVKLIKAVVDKEKGDKNINFTHQSY